MPTRMARCVVLVAVAAALGVTVEHAAVRPDDSGARAGAATAARGPKWRRVFVDRFDRGLDRRKWGRYSGQPGGDPGGWWAPSHVVVRRGVLRLENYRDRRFGGRWVSGGVSSSRALQQTYGKYLVRFRIDGGYGIAGVLLLWPVADQWPPEIDFAEDAGNGPGRRSMTATLHYGSDDNQIQRKVRADFTRWHTIGVEWTPGNLRYTLDGRVWGRARDAGVPHQPMELAMQTQAGTCGDRWAPCPNASTPKRVTMEVDRVVAYAYRGR
jgi:beta-glucanase (GH16 family)